MSRTTGYGTRLALWVLALCALALCALALAVDAHASSSATAPMACAHAHGAPWPGPASPARPGFAGFASRHCSGPREFAGHPPGRR